MAEHDLKAEDLGQFHGSDTWYRHGLKRNFLYTEGVAHVAEHGGAYWLIDEIAFAQHFPQVRREEFQAWKLQRILHEGQLTEAAYLSCEDGSGHQVYTKGIEFTDFPLPEVTLWFENEVLYLPSEH